MVEGGGAIGGLSSAIAVSTTTSHQRVPPAPGLLRDVMLCYLYNKMDLIMHDTLIKLTTDFFVGNTIDAAKRVLHQCDAVKALDTEYIRRKTGLNKDKKTSRTYYLCSTNSPTSFPCLLWLTYRCFHRWMSTMSTSRIFWKRCGRCVRRWRHFAKVLLTCRRMRGQPQNGRRSMCRRGS